MNRKNNGKRNERNVRSSFPVVTDRIKRRGKEMSLSHPLQRMILPLNARVFSPVSSNCEYG